MTVKQYDPKLITLQFAGIIVEGYADGSFVEIEEETEGFEDYSGTDGSVSRSKSSDERGTVTIKLAQTSPTNVLFSSLHQQDKDEPNGAGVGQFLLEDRGNGTTLVRADEAWIMGRPKMDYERAVKEREWKIRLAKMEVKY
jgi:hypothetical protein